MDANGFDTLTKSISRPGTRRGLVQLAVVLPLVSAVSVLLREETVHGKGKRKGQTKQICARAGQTLRKGKYKGCCKGLTTDASERCAAPIPKPDPNPDPTPDPDPSPVPCIGLHPTQDLQEAIDQAEAGSVLTLCAGTWNLTDTVIITKDLTVIGAGTGAKGTILDGGNAVRVLWVGDGVVTKTVTLQHLTITNGRVMGYEYGGGIYNTGTLTLIGVSVTGNTATDEFTATGGGIFNAGGTVTLGTGTSVAGNAASFLGGGILNHRGKVELQRDSHVTGNTAGFFGGGIATSEGLVTLRTGSRVTGNTANYAGGGIYNEFGTVTLEGTEAISPIVVNNCQDNCAGDAVARCSPQAFCNP